MLTSIATIAGAVVAVLSLAATVVAAIKKSSEKKKVQTIQSLNEELKKPLTDEEREKLQNALNDIANS